MNAPIKQPATSKPANQPAFNEPWEVSDDFLYDCQGNLIADLLDDRAAAQRAVACVNACRGLDPAFIPQLMKVVRKVVLAYECETGEEHEHQTMLEVRALLELVQNEGT